MEGVGIAATVKDGLEEVEEGLTIVDGVDACADDELRVEDNEGQGIGKSFRDSELVLD